MTDARAKTTAGSAGRATAESATPSLRDALFEPGSELEETHISWVFLAGDEVFKVKKPVALGFLDFSTPEKRRRACEAEVELNRRLAPDVYLGVVPVTRDGAGRHRFGGVGETVDWAVHMRRLSAAERADRRLERGEIGTAEIELIAARLATFHDGARSDEETARHGSVEAIGGNLRENFEQTRDTIGAHLSAAEAEEIETWQLQFLSRNRKRFAARAAAGRVRDGHGDLRLEHVYLEHGEEGANGGPRVTIVDCIEFNRRFRFADVCADVAFFAMDLNSAGRADLAERFLAAYARESNDYDLYPLVDFYQSYRAYVRAKVASMLAADEGAPAAVRERASSEARRYYLLALACERRPLVPPEIVAVGGVIASGKSTIARALAELMAAPVVDADRTRKHLLGVAPTDPVEVPAFTGAYSANASDRVYREALRRARTVLESGRPVIVEASFRTRAARAAVRQLARDHDLAFRFVECRADPGICRRRLEARPAGVSDGRLEIFDEFVARYEPVEELPCEEHLTLDTSLPLEQSLERLRAEFASWPQRGR